MNSGIHQQGYIPHFKWSFLLPKYWGIWVAVFVLILLSFIPLRLRTPVSSWLGKVAGRRINSTVNRAAINLTLCFPEKSGAERAKIMDDMFALVLPVMLLLVDVVLNKKKKVYWQGLEYIDQVRSQHKNVILMVPHAWAIDLPAMLLAQIGYPMSGMFHHQKNQLVDWLWNKARLHFGGQIHSRNSGIKPFIQSIRHGNIGFYLPDEDHGADQSEFVPFFGTYKATLPILGRLTKLCHAEVLPLFPYYDPITNSLRIQIRPPMNDLVGQSDSHIARRMNEEIEAFVLQDPKQYAWVLRFLKTRKDTQEELY